MSEKVTKLCSRDACKHKGTYTLDVRCSNCGWEGEWEGTKGHEFSGYSSPCPQCECNCLARRSRLIGRSPMRLWLGQTDRGETFTGE